MKFLARVGQRSYVSVGPLTALFGFLVVFVLAVYFFIAVAVVVILTALWGGVLLLIDWIRHDHRR